MKKRNMLLGVLVALVITTFSSCIVRVHDRDYYRERHYRHYHEYRDRDRDRDRW